MLYQIFWYTYTYISTFLFSALFTSFRLWIFFCLIITLLSNECFKIIQIVIFLSCIIFNIFLLNFLLYRYFSTCLLFWVIRWIRSEFLKFIFNLWNLLSFFIVYVHFSFQQLFCLNLVFKRLIDFLPVNFQITTPCSLHRVNFKR